MHVPVPELTALFTAVAPHVPLEDRRRAAGVGAVPTDDLEAAWDKVATLLGVSDGAKAADLARTADPTSVAFIVRAGLDALARENYEDAHGNWPTCIDCGAALEVQHNHCDRCAGPADGALVWLRQETVAAVRRAVGSGQPAEHTAALVRVNRDLNEADLADDGEAAEGGHE
jgi:hypothetical protein